MKKGKTMSYKNIKNISTRVNFEEIRVEKFLKIWYYK